MGFISYKRLRNPGVQFVGASTGASTSSVDLAPPTGSVVGDLWVLLVGTDNNNLPGTVLVLNSNPGWTVKHEALNANAGPALLYRKWDGVFDPPSINFGGAPSVAMLLAFRNHTGSDEFGHLAVGKTLLTLDPNSSSPLSWPAIATLAQGQLGQVLRAGFSGANTGTIDVPAGHTALTGSITSGSLTTGRSFLSNARTNPAAATATPADVDWSTSQMEILGNAPSAVTTVGSTATSNNTGVLPAGLQVGDLVVAHALAGGGQTIPTLASGWTSFLTGTTGRAIQLAYRVYDGIWTAPAWTGASQVHYLACRNVNTVGPIGASTTTGIATNVTSVSWGALDTSTDVGSLVVRGAIFNTAQSIPLPTYANAIGGYSTHVLLDRITTGNASILARTYEADPFAQVATISSAIGRSFGYEIQPA